MEVSVKDVAKLIELNKRKAELEFKKRIFDEQIEEELENIESDISEISERAKSARVELVYPKQNKLEEMSAKIKEVAPHDMKEALSKKGGQAYEMLHERGAIVKENFKNRLEIAKLCVILSMLNDEEKNAVIAAVRRGAIADNIQIRSLEFSAVSNLAKFLSRCGLSCKVENGGLTPGEGAEEIRLELPNKTVWIDKDIKEKLDENLGKIKDVNSKIQLINAERYVKKFTEEEEKNFEELQNEYLNLLKEQDELLGEFNQEANVSVKS